MKKKINLLTHTLFDAAGAPYFLLILGVPIIFIFCTFGLVALTSYLIKKANKKNQQRSGKDPNETNE